MRHTSVFVLILLTSFVAARAQATPGRCEAAHYELIELPLRATGINNSQTIVGTSEAGRAAVWSKRDGLREVETPSGFTHSEGIGLNDHGLAIGIAINRNTTQRQGLTFGNGKVTLLTGMHSRPFAVNDSEEIVGESQVEGATTSAAVIWKGGKATPLGDCCASVAYAINNRGTTIGNIYDKSGKYRAFVWDEAHGLKRIGPAEGFSAALAINQAGEILLQQFPDDIVLYRDGVLKRLALSDKRPAAHPKAMNGCDAIVGSYGPFGDADRAFLWSEAMGFRDLNEVIGEHKGWVLQMATGINEQGEIVGWGEKNREDAGFLLVPKP
jgi:uncharacterized membrane protein